MAYDKAKWHYEGDFPSDLPADQGLVHTGIFLTWIVDNNLFSQELEDDEGEAIALVKSRRALGTYLYTMHDGVFTSDMLSVEGNAFTSEYFVFGIGSYLADYGATVAADLPTLYHVPNTWETYDALKPVLDKRYQEWRRGLGCDPTNEADHDTMA